MCKNAAVWTGARGNPCGRSVRVSENGSNPNADLPVLPNDRSSAVPEEGPGADAAPQKCRIERDRARVDGKGVSTWIEKVQGFEYVIE